MRHTARVLQLQQNSGESYGMAPKYQATVVFRGDAAGSVVLGVSPEVYDRLKVQMDQGEQPDIDVQFITVDNTNLT